MSKQFTEAIKKHQSAFDLNLSDEVIATLDDYYELIQSHNSLLHLVAPCAPEEFAVRHILESLALLEFLPEGAKFADIGAGAGLPSIPCLIARADLRGHLIESKMKKAKFLDEVLTKCILSKRALVFNQQFEELDRGDISFVTCRALDKFAQKLARLLKWSKGCSLLLFGGIALCEELEKHEIKFQKKLLPMSEQRFLFVAQKNR